jgi:hypothetical protein
MQPAITYPVDAGQMESCHVPGQPAGIRIPMDAPVIAGICMMSMGQPVLQVDQWNTIARSVRGDGLHPPLLWGMTGDRGIV